MIGGWKASGDMRSRVRRGRGGAWSLGLALAGVAILIAWVSQGFAYGTTPVERPFGALAALGALAFALYFAAVASVRRKGGATIRGREILLLSALMRLPLVVASQPVQEIDYYRYLWDGRAVREGVSPYLYSPEELDRYRVLGQQGETGGTGYSGAPPVAATVPPEAVQLLGLVERSPAVSAIFERIDHRAVPTIYPPVSQGAFALAAALTPESLPLYWQLAAWRALLAAFDLGTVALLLLILPRLGMPVGLAAVYAWCPLVLKEFANSGHMDAIPVFFTAAAFFALVSILPAAGSAASRGSLRTDSPKSRGRGAGLALAASGALFALAVFSKWYPLLLAPVFVAAAFRAGRWRSLWLPASALAVSGLLLALPQVLPGVRDLGQEGLRSESGGADDGSAGRIDGERVHGDGMPRTDGAGGERAKASGLEVFLSGWEMNDLLFSLVRENLRPLAGEAELDSGAARAAPWYAIVPPETRAALAARLEILGSSVRSRAVPDYLGAQLLCGALLALMVGTMAWRLAFSARPLVGGSLAAATGRALFLSLAAGWYLSSTQNPWYWTWALPFAVFARSRVWLAVAPFAMLYYARFWLIYRFPDPTWGSFDGARLYDEIGVWVVHGPVLVALGCGSFFRKGREPGMRPENG